MSFHPHRTVFRALSPHLLGAAALLASVLPAGAARVVDVRVGLHDAYTRVVLETDAPSKYRIERDASGGIEVYLTASARPGKKTSKSPMLRSVDVSPEADGSRVRLELRGSKVDVREMVLANPPRIVLDLRPAAAGAPSRPAATPVTPDAPKEAAAAPKPAPALAVVPDPAPAPKRAAAPTPEPAPTPEGGFAADPSAGAMRGEEIGVDPAVAERARRLRISQPSAAVLGTEGAQREAAASRAVGEPSVVPAPEAAATPTPTLVPAADPPSADPDSTAAMIAGMEGNDPPEPADDTALAEPDPSLAPDRAGEEFAAALPPESSIAERSGPLPGILARPIALGAIAAGALALVLFVFLRHRGREPELLGSVTHDDEPFSPGVGSAEYDVVAAPEPMDAVDDLPSLPRRSQAARRAAPSNFDDAKEAVAVNESFDTAMEPSFGPPSMGGGINADLMRMVEELERRVSLLEKRLDETVEAKERLERQVAAQTEELRVQRSAIARTQRALRSLAKPEDEATEPVSKG